MPNGKKTSSTSQQQSSTSCLIPRELFIHISRTNNRIEAVHKTQVLGISKVELLEWKATGTTGNPTTSGVYADEVVWLKCEFNQSGGLLHAGLPQKQTTTPDQIGKVMLNVEKPQVVLPDSAVTGVVSTELSGDLRSNPVVLAHSLTGEGYFTGLTFTLHRNPTDDVQVTYSNLYLWLRVWVTHWQ